MENKIYSFIILILSACVLLLVSYLIFMEVDEPIVIGKVEKVGIEAMDTVMKGRIDTGAGMSSLNAEIIEVKKSKTAGEPDIVKFMLKDDLGNTKILEKKVIEWQKIKNKGNDGFTDRPVVKMDLCLGGKEIVGRVNLVDRKNFKYQVLVGRNFLETGDFVVDASTELTSKKSKCD